MSDDLRMVQPLWLTLVTRCLDSQCLDRVSDWMEECWVAFAETKDQQGMICFLVIPVSLPLTYVQKLCQSAVLVCVLQADSTRTQSVAEAATLADKPCITSLWPIRQQIWC